MTGTNGVVALEGGARWVGLVFIITRTHGLGLGPRTGITSLNLLSSPVRFMLIIISRKPVLREAKQLSQGHTVSGSKNSKPGLSDAGDQTLPPVCPSCRTLIIHTCFLRRLVVAAGSLGPA